MFNLLLIFQSKFNPQKTLNKYVNITKRKKLSSRPSWLFKKVSKKENTNIANDFLPQQQKSRLQNRDFHTKMQAASK